MFVHSEIAGSSIMWFVSLCLYTAKSHCLVFSDLNLYVCPKRNHRVYYPVICASMFVHNEIPESCIQWFLCVCPIVIENPLSTWLETSLQQKRIILTIELSVVLNNEYDFIFQHFTCILRGLSIKFVDTANKTRIVYQRLMEFCINKYQLSGNMHTQYDSVFLNIDWFISP